MNIYKSLLIILLVSFLLSGVAGCNLFSTRTPEDPISTNNTYLPPTSAKAVINNFVNSINEKNIGNYMSCFADSAGIYKFYPSSEALSLHQSIFENWSLNSERNYLNSIIIHMPKDINPALNLSNEQYQFFPDSTIYTYNYNLRIYNDIDAISVTYAGLMQLVIFRNTNGMWHIKSWTDAINTSDTLKATWSILKARNIN